MTVLFLCSGNTCRSTMCEWYFRDLIRKNGLEDEISCTSAGISAAEGASASRHAREILAENGIDISAHQSRQLTKKMMEHADRIVCMAPRHLDYLMRIRPDLSDRFELLADYLPDAGRSIPDPYGRTLAVYRDCFGIMKQAMEQLFAELSGLTTEQQQTV